jgi:hypothetical protein
MEKINEFEHDTSSNCETGVMRNLMNHHGWKISEDLLFGIGSGLYFIHFPFVKIGPIEPLTAFRYTPGAIIKKASKLIGVDFEMVNFKSPDKAMEALDQKIQEGTVVGVTGDLYYFEVFPEFMQFHFANHNIVVYGKRGDKYLVSDPIVEQLVEIDEEKLKKARFTNTSDDPKGRMYWIKNIDKSKGSLKHGIKEGIKTTCKRMLNPYFPFGGVSGMRYLAKKLEKYPLKKSPEYASKHLTNVIRHQEIVGSGGSGYRKQFGRFLVEAGQECNYEPFTILGREMLDKIAVVWRDLAVEMGRCMRLKSTDIPEKYKALADSWRNLATIEKDFFKRLQQANNNYKF